MGERQSHSQPDFELDLYQTIHGMRVSKDATQLDPALVAEMPLNSASVYYVKTGNEQHKRSIQYPVMVAKYENFPAYNQVIRIAPKDNRYVMEALQFERDFFKNSFKNAPFLDDIPDDAVTVGFNIHTKVLGVYHPVLRAREFISWALQAYEMSHVTQLLSDFEAGSDTFAAYQSALQMTGGDEVEAMQRSFPHAIFTNLGFELIPRIYHSIYPKPVVCALYQKMS
ncbi:MAG: hypothetical protein WCO78_00020 [Candidatus Roizmanbacteria bacterium]